MTSLTEKQPAESQFDKHIETFLELSQHDYRQARLTRIRYFRFAHNHGWTYERIGRQVGITGAAVRRLLRRNPENVA